MSLNNRGFSLIEILIVMGMLASLSAIVINITKQSTKSSAKFQFDSDVTLTTNEINSILSDPVKCLATFTTPSQTTEPNRINNGVSNKYYISTNGSAPANGYGTLDLKLPVTL